MKVLHGIIFIILACFISYSPVGAAPEPPSRHIIAFYNLENLYDTIPSPLYDDSDYTPTGRNRWDSGRYRTKLTNLARVIDDIGADILGICEIENEAALKDLVRILNTDYNYIHFESSDRRGMDVALLYNSLAFVPDTSRLIYSGTTREFLHVQGTIYGTGIDIIVCHMPSALNNMEYRRKAFGNLCMTCRTVLREGTGNLIVMGDFNTPPGHQLMKVLCSGKRSPDTYRLRSFIHDFSRRGTGSYVYGDRWNLIDNILLSDGLLETFNVFSAGVFGRSYMVDRTPGKRYGYPLRTFTGSTYLGGFSDHLPVFTVLEKEERLTD